MLLAPERVILHGCNNQGVMGSGVARQIRNKWPVVYEAYSTMNLMGIRSELGMIQPAVIERDPVVRWVINVITQDGYGNDGARYASLDAIDIGLEKVSNFVKMFPGEGTKVALPMIGAGLGGLKWELVAPIVEYHLGDDAVVYYLN